VCVCVRACVRVCVHVCVSEVSEANHEHMCVYVLLYVIHSASSSQLSCDVHMFVM
jgi:hypothetical protein